MLAGPLFALHCLFDRLASLALIPGWELLIVCFWIDYGARKDHKKGGKDSLLLVGKDRQCYISSLFMFSHFVNEELCRMRAPSCYHTFRGEADSTKSFVDTTIATNSLFAKSMLHNRVYNANA
jgi:hypothetical protein